MFFDLSVPLPTPGLNLPSVQSSKKGKQKQKQSNIDAGTDAPLVFTSAQIAALESRIDVLVHLGYTVLALNQTVQTKVDSRTHVDWLRGLIPKLRKRNGIVILKRLTVCLDEGSEKGNGVNPQHASLLSEYDILSLRPTTHASFSQACLMHSAPSPQTAHIISIPVTLPRLPFYLKHTLVRMALKNGVVFEIDYAGAVGIEAERRNWWGGAREVVRVTKGKGILLSGGASEDKEIRAPKDAANLVTLLGIPQDLSHKAITQTPKSLVLRAQMRKTYRSTLSEPKLIFPQATAQPPSLQPCFPAPTCDATSREESAQPPGSTTTLSAASDLPTRNVPGGPQTQPMRKRRHEEDPLRNAEGQKKKKKRL